MQGSNHVTLTLWPRRWCKGLQGSPASGSEGGARVLVGKSVHKARRGSMTADSTRKGPLQVSGRARSPPAPSEPCQTGLGQDLTMAAVSRSQKCWLMCTRSA